MISIIQSVLLCFAGHAGDVCIHVFRVDIRLKHYA